MFSIPMLMILAGAGFLGYWLYKRNEAKKAIEEAEAMIPEEMPEGEEGEEEEKEFIVTVGVGLGLIYFFPGAALLIIGIILLLLFF